MDNQIEAELSRPVPVGLILEICTDWALCHDELQWIIFKWRGPKQGWRPMAFVSSSTCVVRRVLDELDIVPSDEADAALDEFPTTYTEWLIRPSAHKEMPRPVFEGTENGA